MHKNLVGLAVFETLEKNVNIHLLHQAGLVIWFPTKDLI